MSAHQIRASWIWCQGEERPKNFYLYVRRSLEISVGIHRALIRLTADSRYRLFVNGIHVARGPARCDRRWQCLDEWDITDELREGRNVIAALVHHYGEWTFAYMLGRAGFLAELDIELDDGQVMHIGTDSSWRVQSSRAWERNLPRMSIQLGYPEIYDAREAIEGWTDRSYDDSHWESATVLGPVGMEPWPGLESREIPALTEVQLLPECVIDAGEVGNARTGHYVDLLRVVWSTSHAVAYLTTFVWSSEETEAEIHAGSQEAIRLWINGEVVISHLVSRDPAPDQEIASIHLRSGWNTVLAKIVQGEGQWHFYFRVEGKGRDRLVYSKSPDENPAETDGRSPWWIIGPFESESLNQGFEAVYPPEQKLDFSRAYRGKDGKEIRWISAGVTSESMLTSIIMGREERFPLRGTAVDDLDGLIIPGEPAILHPGADYGRYAVIDFGKEVTGYPAIEIDRAVGGEIIDLGYGEVMQTASGDILPPSSGKGGILNPDRAGVHYADRYVCKPGRQRFQTFDKRAFRYLQLDVRNLREPIAVGPVSLVFSTYPVDYLGSFECSDAVLNRIWEVGRWTVQLNMEDAYTDCPWRERGQWWGDVRVEALVNYYAFGDLALVRRGLRQLAQSQTNEGLTMGVYPTDWSNGILPTFTLLWIVSLRDFFEFSGELAFVAELFPAIERAMEYYERYRSEHDLLRDVPYWLFVDWADVETAGESASVNALYHGALCAAAELAGAIGNGRLSTEFRGRADRIRAGMHKYLWDDRTKCFRDARKEGMLSPKISEQANCWAVVFGAAPSGMTQSILESVFDEQHATVKVATPYFAFYVLSALAKAGEHERSLQYIRKHWGDMLDWGATTWWEQWEPKASFCHGWSSGPTHYLPSEILGVQPGKPGWEEILITPHRGSLAWARGKVPTRRGIVSVDWREEEDFTVVLDVPAPVKVVVPKLKQGVVSVTGANGSIQTLIAGPDGKGREVTVVLREPGQYRIHSA